MAERPVVNSSPLIFLSNGGLLELLQLAGNEVVVPMAVAIEIQRRGQTDITVQAIESTPLMILFAVLRPDVFLGWPTLVSGKETSPLCGTTGILLMFLVDSSVWIEVFRPPLFAAFPPGIPDGNRRSRGNRGRSGRPKRPWSESPGCGRAPAAIRSSWSDFADIIRGKRSCRDVIFSLAGNREYRSESPC